MSGPARTAGDFVELLERCRAQVEGDPSNWDDNAHLYMLLERIHLRLCHGNIPDQARAVEVQLPVEERGTEGPP